MAGCRHAFTLGSEGQKTMGEVIFR